MKAIMQVFQKKRKIITRYIEGDNHIKKWQSVSTWVLAYMSKILFGIGSTYYVKQSEEQCDKK